MEHVHIALFRWKPSASLDEIEEALSIIESLSDVVPGIIDISVGFNASKYGEGYTHAVLVRAETQDAIDSYRKHPDHERAAAILDAAEDHGIGVDFSTDSFAAARRGRSQ